VKYGIVPDELSEQILAPQQFPMAARRDQ
jgi:hypothetical protein